MATVTIGMAGRVVISAEEFEEWWDEQRDARAGGRVCFYDALRREVARRERLPNFRQLQLAGADGALGPGSDWQQGPGAGTAVTAVRRQLLSTKGMELLESARQGNAAEVIALLEEPQSPEQEEDGDPVAHGSPFFWGVFFFFLGGVVVFLCFSFFFAGGPFKVMCLRGVPSKLNYQRGCPVVF
ncbi:unnamed protein product [Effrenium voratum]|nr:unnamed protein product [Effrenium voratum]